MPCQGVACKPPHGVSAATMWSGSPWTGRFAMTGPQGTLGKPVCLRIFGFLFGIFWILGHILKFLIANF